MLFTIENVFGNTSESVEFRYETHKNKTDRQNKTDQSLIIAGAYKARAPRLELLGGPKICFVKTLIINISNKLIKYTYFFQIYYYDSYHVSTFFL